MRMAETTAAVAETNGKGADFDPHREAWIAIAQTHAAIKAGLLERTFCETDRRVSYATLLPAGAELLEEMRPLVRAELATTFTANLSVAEAEGLRETMERIRGSACGTS